MSATVWIILSLVILGIGALSLLSNLLTRTPRAWRDLSDDFPPTDPAPDAKRGETRALIAKAPPMPEMPDPLHDPRRRYRPARPHEFDARWAADLDHLHLAQHRGPVGTGVAASIPWALMRLPGTHQGHMGEFASIIIDDRYILMLPTAVVEGEMEFLGRAMAQASPGRAAAPASPILIDAPPKT